MHVFLRTLAAMNTRLSLLVPGMEEGTGDALAGDVAMVLAEQERVMSRFADDAELAGVNRRASEGAVPLSDALYAVLAECRQHWVRTGGAFDITLGAINDGWRGDSAVPPQTGWEHVDLDPDRRSIAFRVRGLRLDLGGIGKGIALRAVRDLLHARGIDRAVVSFGDSSIVAIGAAPQGGDWQIGIGDGFDAARTIGGFALRDEAMSTSGTTRGLPHLIDPQTRQAVGLGRQLSIACACPVDAEILSTALIAAPPAARAAILRAYPPARALEFGWRTPDANGLDAESPEQEIWRHAA